MSHTNMSVAEPRSIFEKNLFAKSQYISDKDILRPAAGSYLQMLVVGPTLLKKDWCSEHKRGGGGCFVRKFISLLYHR